MAQPLQREQELDVTRQAYDRLAPAYDLIAGRFEWPLVRAGLGVLSAQPGERVLEVGHGTGRALVELARAVGDQGRVVGADLSPGMAAVAQKRLEAAGLIRQVELTLGDALLLPCADHAFDAAFSAFTVETFPPQAAAALLVRLRRALRPGGRLVLVSMAHGDRGAMSALYAWSHRHFPHLVDCAPIDAAALLTEAGFTRVQSDAHRLAGIAVAVTRAETPA